MVPSQKNVTDFGLARKEKNGKSRLFLGLTYDLRYFFDYCFFYFTCPEHFWHVDGKKQPGYENSFDCYN